MRVSDALGRELRLEASPRRIVSLVPSITETLFAFGLGASIVGVTEFCVHPSEAMRDRAVVGGTKNPDVGRILSLRPDLVLANKEENRRRDVERLAAANVPVFVSWARTVREALDEIATLGTLTGCGEQAARIVAAAEAELPSLPTDAARPRVVALIWKRPYMAVGGDTFAGDLLRQCGGENPFERTVRRYPRIDERDLEAARPDVILLPTEPYAFTDSDRQELLRLACPASASGRVHVVEGELLTWYGPRIPRALRELAGLITAG